MGIADTLKISADQLLLRGPAKSPSKSEEELYELFNGCTAEAKMFVFDILEGLNALFPSTQPADF